MPNLPEKLIKIQSLSLTISIVGLVFAFLITFFLLPELILSEELNVLIGILLHIIPIVLIFKTNSYFLEKLILEHPDSVSFPQLELFSFLKLV